MEPIARRLHQEIGLIEEEHVTHDESLVDPGETWWEQLVRHEYHVQEQVHGGEEPPSERGVAQHRESSDREFRMNGGPAPRRRRTGEAVQTVGAARLRRRSPGA